MGIRWTVSLMGWVRSEGVERGGRKASRWEKSAAREEPASTSG
jgi:hypothetical protein